MNPGTCPECGAVVAAGSLLASPATLRRRRVVRRICLAIVPLILVAMAIFVYDGVNWARWLPTNVLLILQGNYRGTVGRELLQRFSAGTLTPEQTQTLFDPYVDKPVLQGYPKYPANVPFKIQVLCRAKPPTAPWVCGMVDWQLSVDGKPVDTSDMRTFQDQEDEDSVEDRWIWCPPLSEGRHHITVDGVATLKLMTTQGISSVLHHRTVRLSRDVKISDSLRDYVQPVASPKQVAQMRRSVAASVFLDPEISSKTVLAIRYASLPTPMAGMVLARTSQESAFIPLREVFHPSGSSGVDFFYLDPKLHLDRTGSMDVLINPDPLISFHHRTRFYFNGVVQWHRLPIHSDVRVREPGRLAQVSVAPTNISLNQQVGGE